LGRWPGGQTEQAGGHGEVKTMHGFSFAADFWLQQSATGLSGPRTRRGDANAER
jgi:hypothetical protein